MEEKQEKVKIDYFKLIILIGVIFGFIFLILGILCWFSFLLVNRGGHCDIASVFSDLSRTPSLIFLIVSGLLNLTVLVYIKKDKDKFKTVRFFLRVFLIVSLVLIVFAMYIIVTDIINLGCTGQDIAVIEEISDLRKTSNVYVENNNESYEGFCDSEDVKKIKEWIIEKEIKYFIYCNDDSKEWAACSQLRFFDNYYSCSDSSNNAKKIKGKCDENWNYTQCPL